MFGSIISVDVVFCLFFIKSMWFYYSVGYLFVVYFVDLSLMYNVSFDFIVMMLRVLVGKWVCLNYLYKCNVSLSDFLCDYVIMMERVIYKNVEFLFMLLYLGSLVRGGLMLLL